MHTKKQQTGFTRLNPAKLVRSNLTGFTPLNTAKGNLTGFTLLEMVIAMGIFIILFISVLGIYSYSIQAEQRSTQLSKLQKEAQLIMEVLAKKIRTSKVYYDYYGGSIPTDEDYVETLALIDKNNDITVFVLKDESIGICGQGACALDEDFSTIPAQDITITSLKFFISPTADPFSLDNPPTAYPRITTVINFRHIQGKYQRDLLVQQTVPQRLGGF
ncbi:MAG: hypothetical protein ABIJ91_05150 [Candidatus Kuenenbacteria bacterium]